MVDSALTAPERALLRALNEVGVRFMVVGMSAALIQGARGATEDIDLWFENVTDPRIGECVRSAGGIWVSGAFGMGSPQVGGDELGERFDVVTHMSGLADFATEYKNVRFEWVDGVSVPLLPLVRILQSKKVAGRSKDSAQLHALEDAIALLGESSKGVAGSG